jgi:hypothetical protein
MVTCYLIIKYYQITCYNFFWKFHKLLSDRRQKRIGQSRDTFCYKFIKYYIVGLFGDYVYQYFFLLSFYFRQAGGNNEGEESGWYED